MELVIVLSSLQQLLSKTLVLMFFPSSNPTNNPSNGQSGVTTESSGPKGKTPSTGSASMILASLTLILLALFV